MSLSAHSSYDPNVYFMDEERKLLNQFSCVAWGHPDLFLKKATFPEAGDIEFIDLREYFPAIQLLFNSIMEHSTILVRNEYHVALDALQGAQYSRGAFVIGQPGIGKTLFLIYLIVHFLGQKRAVALQLSWIQPCYALFSKEGVGIHSAEESGPLLNHPSPVWVLCDSNQDSLIPYSGFTRRPGRVRVIQTTSPKSSRWKEWSKQAGACRFVMDVWSLEEVKKLAILLQLDVGHMTELAKKLGGVPRTLLQYYRRPDNVVEDKYRVMASHAIRECPTMLAKGRQCDLPDDAPSSFYFIRPKTIRDMDPYIVVPTRTLWCFLAEGLQQENKAIKLQFFRALSQPAETRQVAGYIYESWFHSFLSTEAKEIQCQWIASGSQDGAMQKLQSATTVIWATQEAPLSWTPPFYWIPRDRNFPGIDSALISENEIFAIQVTIAKRRRSSPTLGLSKLQELLPNDLKNLSWNLVFVGDDEDRIQGIAKKYAGKIFFPTGKIRVGWSVVNPVQEQVVYKHFRDETDLSAEESMDGEH